MEQQPVKVTVTTSVNATPQKVWEYWTKPEHIIKWNSASPDWHTPRAENDVRPGGKFSSRMEAKDGSMGFDFWGTYDQVDENKLITYTMGDGRKVEVHFTENGKQTDILEIFDAEETNPVEMQQFGWQSIMNSFKTYTEEN
jgi:uncharacterized protein YndB with AHSA1/START domain